jgi:surface carbohydrate biosynthesis protein
VSSEVLNGVDCLFAWGEENAAAWRGHPGYGGTPIRMTGNPRADLLRPELRGFFATEAEELAARFGEFVLLNTNFSRLNHYTPGESRQRRLIEDAGGPLEDGGDPRLGLAAHKQRLYRRFLHLVPKLGRRFPRNAIVVRPHPSENPNPWRQVAAEHPNVHVVHEGSVVPWLMAARAVVHNGCTTAVETFLLGGVPLAYRPVVSEEFDHPLPNALGVAARDDEALLEHVENALGGRLLLRADTLAAQRRLATRHVASLEGESACARIAAALEEILATTEGQGARALPTRLIGRFSARRRGLVKRLEAVLPNHRNNSRYVRHLFPPIGVEEVEARVARFASLLGRFTRVRARELRPNVFAVQSG